MKKTLALLLLCEVLVVMGFSSALAQAKTITLTSGNGQTDIVSSSLSQPFIVTITDDLGAPVAGVPVTFSLTGSPTGASGQSLSITSATTNASGQASSTLTLGSKPGTYSVDAESGTLVGSPIGFSATAVAGPAKYLALTSGDGQSREVATTLPSPFVVTVTDAEGNPVSGKTVNFNLATIPTGATGTSLSANSDVTDVNGQASTVLTLGTKKGTYTVTAAAGGLTPASVTFTSTGLSGPATQVRLELRADGNSKLITDTTLQSAYSLTGYVITRDLYDNFVNNVAADSIKLVNRTDGVDTLDMVVSGDRRSETFTADLIGTGRIQVWYSTFTRTSGLITVIHGTPARIKAETKADGSGKVVPDTTLVSGTSLTAYAIQRDINNNYIANVAADTWTLPTKTGGVVDGDLVVNIGGKSAVFNAHKIGTGTIRATWGALAPTVSGTVSVTVGTASKIDSTSGGGQSGQVTAPLGSPFVVTVTDASGNPVSGRSVIWAVASYPPGSTGQTINPVSTVTDASGHASSTLTIGTKRGPYTVTATSAGLTGSPVTFTATGTSGAATQLRIETAADGSGTLITDESLAMGAKDTAFAITRDTYSNYVANVSAAWSLTNITGSVLGTDLAPSSGISSIFTAHGAGSARIQAVYGVMPAATSGIITVTAGTASKIRVETKPDGTGTVVPDQTLLSSRSITVYAIARDASDNFLRNVAAATWSLQGKAGGVADSDLVVSGDRKNATFTGHVAPGTGKIQADSAGLAATPSGTITVALGTDAKVRVETKADGTGTIVPAQTILASRSITVYAICRDSSNNFKRIIAADPTNGWTMVNKSGGVADSNLTISSDRMSAIFTGEIIGSGQVQAKSGSLQSVPSGTITVDRGTPAKVRVETKADGSGVVVPDQVVASGDSIRVYAVVRDSANNFWQNVPANAWSLIGKTGGVIDGDLAASTDKMSAVFTGHGLGGAKIQATSSTLQVIPSGQLTVGIGTAARLVFVQQPSTVVSQLPMSPAVTVRIVDVNGNPVSDSRNVTLSLLHNTTGATLGGTTTVAASGGIATFSNLSVDKADSQYTLRASSAPVLTMDTSDAFIVLPGVHAGFTVLDSVGGPIPTEAAGAAFKIRISAVDAAGNVVPTFTGTVNVTANNGGILGTGAGTTLGFTAGVLAAHTVSFSNMGNFSISVRNTMGFEAGTSNVFAVTAGAPGQVVFVQQPTNTVSGNAITPAMTVQLQDAFGNNVPQASVAVTMELWSGTGVLTGTKTRMTNSFGIASFANLSLDSAGVKTLRAKSGTLSPAISDSFLISPGAPARLWFATNPGTGAAGAPLTVQPVISLQDQFGNTVLGFAENVTLAIQTNPSLGALSGTRTLPINTATGQVGFTDLSIDKAGIGYTLTATGQSVSTTPGVIVSAPFNVTSGTASKLAFSVQPTNAIAGAIISPAVVVQLQDQYGNLVEVNDTLITLSMDSTGNLGGNVSRSTIAGLATFNDLRVDKEGTKVLKATGTGLTGTTSASFAISPGPAAKLAFVTQPGGGVAGHLLAPQPVLILQDGFGNTVKGTAQEVTVSMKDTATTGASLNGGKTAAVNTATGLVSFSDLSIDKAGVGFTLTAVGSTVDTARGGVVSQPITIIAGSAQKLRIETLADGKGTTLSSQNVSSGVPVTVYAIGRDSLGNFAGNLPADQWQLVEMTGGANPANLVPAPDRKSAAFTGTVIGSSARILATMAGLTPDTSGVLSVVQAGAPAKVLVETSPNGTGTRVPSQSIASGGSITVYAVARDAANNFVGNIQADGWSLHVLSGDIQQGDIVPSPDRRSAVFMARKMGRARIVDSVGTLTQVPSDTIRVTPGTPASVAVGSKSPDSARVNNYFGSRLITLVRDSSGNPVRDVLVTYSVPASGATSVFDDAIHTATTDSLGQAASKPLRANTVIGQYSDTARVAGIADPALFVLRNLSGVPATVTTVTGTPQTTEVATAFPLPLVVSVKDSFGNPAEGVQVTFTAPPSGPSGTFQSGTNSAYTNAQGVATSAVFVANLQAGSYAVQAHAGAAPPASFVLTNGAGNPGIIEVVDGAGQSAMVGKAFTKRLKARVKDGANNVKPDVVVHFTAPASGATGSFPGGISDSSTTDTLGIATSSVFTADTIAGTYNVTATVMNMAASAQFALTNAPGAVDTFAVEAAGGGNIGQQTAHVPFAIKITAKDAYENVATGFTGTATITSSGSLWSGGGKTASFVAGVLDSHAVSMEKAGGPYSLTATRTGGAESGKSNSFNVINPNPTVRSITPSNGVAGQTLIVTILGSGFIDGVSSVTFGDQITTTKLGTTDSTLTVRISIDLGATLGPRDVMVYNLGAQPYTVVGGFIVGDNPRPTVASLNPDSAVQQQSARVTLHGSGLIGATQISFIPSAGLTLDSVGIVDPTAITFRLLVAASAVPGFHDVIVTNPIPGGGSDTLRNGLWVIPASVNWPWPPTLATPVDGSQGQSSTLMLSWQSVAVATHYDIQVATAPTFSASEIVVFDSMLTSTSRQVGPLTTQKTYYWRVRSRNAVGISGWSGAWSFDNIPYPVTYNLTNTVDFPTHENAADYTKEEYQLVGLPGAGPASGQNNSLSSLIPGTAGKDWDAYSDNGAQNNFWVQFSEGNPLFTFAPGRGFWLIKKGPWALANQVVNTATLRPATSTVNIKLQSGWNIITNPFLDSLQWESVRTTNAMVDSEKIWGWKLDGLFQSWYSSAYMVAYRGYYYYNDPGVLPVLDSLKFPYSLRLGKRASKIAAAAVDSNAWNVSVDLKVGKFQDRSTILGVSSFALEGKDPSDYHKPRPFDEIPAVYFDRPEWDKYYSIFGGDIRNPINRIGIWEFTVSTIGPKAGNAEINFRGLENIPANFGVYLVDEAGACYRDLRKEGSAYKFVPPAPTAKFKLLVGTKEALDQEAEKIVPRSFALEQNYPNPFNPSTTIPVSVPYAADVTLKIYNIMGQEVATVFSGTLEPGKHRFSWEGRNSVGASVATGVYFVRMTTVSGPSFVGKMLLMK